MEKWGFFFYVLLIFRLKKFGRLKRIEYGFLINENLY